MYQPNQSQRLSQAEFQDRLNEIVKLIKQKEEINLQLIQYLQLTLTKSQQLSLMVFLQDQISKHKLFLQKITQKNQQLLTKTQSIQKFYQLNITLNQNEKSLLRRVSARIIELFQTYNQKVQKYPAFQNQISTHYKLIKPKLIKQITLIDKTPSTMLHISQLCNAFFTYLENKFNDQTKKINQIIQLIQNGEIHLIQSAFICQHCKSVEITIPNSQQNSEKITSNKSIQIKPVYQSPQQKYFQKQKEKINQKLKVMRQQAKNKQTIKKKKLKFATKYYSLYHHAMDIHKAFFIDQFTHLDQNQQKSKILIEMQQRNKHNLTFIHSFIQDCTVKNMDQKIASMKQLIHSKNFQVDGKKNEEVKLQHSHKNRKYQRSKNFQDSIIQKDSPEPKHFQSIEQYKFPQPGSHPELGIEQQEKNQVKSFRITNPNKKGSIPTPKSNPNLFSIKQFGQSSQNFNFVKINMKNVPIQRARLPDISNRMFSTQQRQKSSKMIEKLENNISPNNNLLIIKTSLTKATVDNKKVQKKKKGDESNKIESVIAKLDKNNSHKFQRMERRMVENSISPITINPLPTGGSIGTIARNKKVKRSDSGNKIIVQTNERVSYKTIQINYSTHINKKIKNFCQTVAITQSPQ